MGCSENDEVNKGYPGYGRCCKPTLRLCQEGSVSRGEDDLFTPCGTNGTCPVESVIDFQFAHVNICTK